MNTVSVIVPMYNAEKYVDRCMQCLLGQTLENMELIVINDASKDSTRTLLDKYRQQYSERIKVIHLEENRGPGGARNIAMENVSGEYVGFMDCDDIIDLTMYEKLYRKAIEENLDIVDCGYYTEAENISVLSFSDDIVGELDQKKKNQIITGVGYSVTKIFRTSMLKENDCRFREGVIYEDLDYLIHIARIANKVGNVKEVLYQYVDNSNSATKEQNEQKKFDDMLAVMKVLIDMDQTKELHESMEYVQLNCFIAAIGICLLNQENEKFSLLGNLKMLKEASNNRWPNWQENTYIKNMPEENQQLIQWFETLNV